MRTIRIYAVFAVLVIVMVVGVFAARGLPRPAEAASVPSSTEPTITLTVPNHDYAGFTSVSQLGSKCEVISHKIMINGGTTEAIAQVIGRRDFEHVVLTRPLTGQTDLSAWMRLIDNADLKHAQVASATITVSDGSSFAAQWKLTKTWPCKLDVYSGSDGVLYEQVTLVADKIVRVSVAQPVPVP
jgi:phage tail-like protein